VPGHKADHSPPPSAKVNNAENCNSIPACVFMAWCLLKHKDKLTFTLNAAPQVDNKIR